MERELTRLIETLREAGTLALDLTKQGFEVRTKPDRSLVTTADLEVDRLLHQMQQTHFPGDGWLSEESPDDPARLTSPRVWIVDPIDGTSAYVNRQPEFSISVALVEQGSPLLAAVFNPSTDECFTAVRGAGLRLNGKPVDPPPPETDRPLVLIGARESQIGRWAALDRLARCRPMLSVAYALALVAAGRAQAALTIEPENEWDLAAGALLIQESGGTITDAAGRALTFNQPTPRFQGVIAIAASAGRELGPLLHTQIAQVRTRTPRP
jgi:myo-inositol-1(or 4)-monophosphatase